MLRAGLLGYGFAGRCFHAPFLGPTGFDLVAVSTSREAEVAARWPVVTVHSRAEEVIAREDIDVIVVATPNDSHAPLAIAALKAGKHVVVAKPMALNLSEAETMAEIARRTGRALLVFHNRRWDADFLTVRKALAAGDPGRVFAFEAHFNRHSLQGLGRWRGAGGPGSGLLADLGPHVVDQALLLFGQPEGRYDGPRAWFLLLPPYSPDLNQIEMAFAKLKALIRRAAARTYDEHWQAVGQI